LTASEPPSIPNYDPLDVCPGKRRRCAFLGTGRRCSATGLLEFHHRIPFADGGEATLENVELRCRSHNAYESLLWIGGQAGHPAEPSTTTP
jgi:hypothetical protein